MGSFVRRVRTASGATAADRAQAGRTVLGIEHIGSAHDEGQLAMLLETARAQLNAGQQMLPIEDSPTGGRPIGEPLVEGTASLVVWQTLEAVYACLGFDQIADEAFKALVLARIIEPQGGQLERAHSAALGSTGLTRGSFLSMQSHDQLGDGHRDCPRMAVRPPNFAYAPRPQSAQSAVITEIR
jgi:hypothetical protein